MGMNASLSESMGTFCPPYFSGNVRCSVFTRTGNDEGVGNVECVMMHSSESELFSRTVKRCRYMLLKEVL